MAISFLMHNPQINLDSREYEVNKNALTRSLAVVTFAGRHEYICAHFNNADGLPWLHILTFFLLVIISGNHRAYRNITAS